ncbi:hypothetical protein M426DRAFT_236818 [Hypoxylon sp. CI-4A]|nr:hypothetical protein M426DRAFT_236818 [Hypoxylon sp. CI-4A]
MICISFSAPVSSQLGPVQQTVSTLTSIPTLPTHLTQPKQHPFPTHIQREIKRMLRLRPALPQGTNHEKHQRHAVPPQRRLQEPRQHAVLAVGRAAAGQAVEHGREVRQRQVDADALAERGARGLRL